MLSSPYLLLGILIVIAILGLLVAVKVARIYNSPEGERIQRMRMQGPFVPLSADEIEEDEKRAEGKQA